MQTNTVHYHIDQNFKKCLAHWLPDILIDYSKKSMKGMVGLGTTKQKVVFSCIFSFSLPFVQ